MTTTFMAGSICFHSRIRPNASSSPKVRSSSTRAGTNFLTADRADSTPSASPQQMKASVLFNNCAKA